MFLKLIATTLVNPNGEHAVALPRKCEARSAASCINLAACLDTFIVSQYLDGIACESQSEVPNLAHHLGHRSVQ
jgi:hypothetical protein